MKYKVGDKVLIVSKTTDGMNPEGKMDKWLGKTMTIRELCSTGTIPRYKMLEDKNENILLRGWNWTDDMIAGLADERELIVLYRNGNTINATYKVGDKIVKKANARCNPSDKFNFNKGAQLAFNRLVYGTDYHPAEVAFKQEMDKHLYNAKVVCIESNCGCWTAGKIYTIANSVITDDNGWTHIIDSFKILCKYTIKAAWLEIIE